MAFNLRGILSLDNSGFNKGLNQSAKNAESFSTSVRRSESSVKGLFKSAAKLGLGVGIAKFAKDSIMLASDLGEIQNVVDTTFKGASKEIDSFAKTSAKKFGVSELQAKKFNGTLGAIMKSSGVSGDALVGMSKDLTGLAGDMASFYNLQPDEAFDKLRSAISGESEPMKALGVNMSVVNMEAFALTKGIKKQWKEMSQAEQTTLRYQYIMDATKDSQGDFTKTSGSFANQLKIAKMNVADLGANLALNFLPALNDGIKGFNGFIMSVQDSSTPIGAFASDVKDNAVVAMDMFKSGLTWLIDNKDVTITAIKLIAGAYGIHAVAVGVSNLAMIASNVQTGIATAGSWALNAAIVALYAKDYILAGATGVVTAAQWLFNAALTANPIGLVIVGVAGLVTGMIVAYNKLEWFRDLVNGVWDVLKGFGETVANTFGAVKDFGANVGNKIKGIFGGDTPQNANGTSYFKGGLSTVNERGGEMQVLRNGTSVIPADRTKQILEQDSSGGLKSQTIQIILDGKMLTEVVVGELIPQLQLRMSNM